MSSRSLAILLVVGMWMPGRAAEAAFGPKSGKGEPSGRVWSPGWNGGAVLAARFGAPPRVAMKAARLASRGRLCTAIGLLESALGQSGLDQRERRLLASMHLELLEVLSTQLLPAANYLRGLADASVKETLLEFGLSRFLVGSWSPVARMPPWYQRGAPAQVTYRPGDSAATQALNQIVRRSGPVLVHKLWGLATRIEAENRASGDRRWPEVPAGPIFALSKQLGETLDEAQLCVGDGQMSNLDPIVPKQAVQVLPQIAPKYSAPEVGDQLELARSRS